MAQRRNHFVPLRHTSNPLVRAARGWQLGLALLTALAAPEIGSAACVANDLCSASTNPCVVSGAPKTIDSGCVLDFGSRAVEIRATLKNAVAGGSFALRAGQILLSGKDLQASGSPSVRGGTLRITTTGLFRIESGASIDVSASGNGGSIIVLAGSLELFGSAIKASGTSALASGGVIDLRATGTAQIATPLTASGGGESNGGNVIVRGSTVTVSKTIIVDGGNSDGGSIDLEATGTLSVTGATTTLRSNGGFADEFAGYGGEISLVSGSDLSFGGRAESLGASPDGLGGFITLSALRSLTTLAGSTIVSSGNGSESSGGDVTLEAGFDVSVAGVADVGAGGDGFGGNIYLDSGHDVVVTSTGKLTADAGGLAGFISTGSPGLLRVDGLIDAHGFGGSGDGGKVTLGGHCGVSLGGTIDVTAIAPATAGTIDVLAGSISLASTAILRATPCGRTTGSCNRFTMRAGAPVIAAGASVSPSASLALSSTIALCCGNGRLDAGEQCDDGNTLHCDGCTAGCSIEPTPACASDGNTCTEDCSPTLGCRPTRLPDGTACPDEGSVCTTDACRTGVCRHTTTLVCNDGLACTGDWCHATNGCMTIAYDSRCDDGIECTTNRCDLEAGCMALPRDELCDDSVACTADACNPASGCTVTPDHARCDDGVACTAGICDLTEGCRQTPDNSRCSDGVTCTVDTCDALLGCASAANDALCADAFSCTANRCDASEGCLVTTDDTLCSDTNACTLNSCSPSAGCTSTAVAAGSACDDGSVCTQTDACSGIVCQGSNSLSCDDQDRCTVDRCDPLTACGHAESPALCPCSNGGQPLAVGTACVDGSGCTVGDTCNGAGTCTAGVEPECSDGDSCTSDSCSGGRCVHADDLCLADCTGATDGTPCSDGALCAAGSCLGGACTTLPMSCDDSDQCNGLELCVEASGLGCVSIEPALYDPFCRAADDFHCYKARTTPGTRPISARNVTLSGPLDTRTLRTGASFQVCNPVATDSSLIVDPATHLGCYKLTEVRGATKFAPRIVRVLNRFGLQTLSVSKPVGLCLPSDMNVAGSTLQRDQLECYSVRGTGTIGASHQLKDDFWDGRVTVLTPVQLCTAVGRDGVAPVAPDEHLVCYRERALSSAPDFLDQNVRLSNAFGSFGEQAVSATSSLGYCISSHIAD